ncbi:hypothetical protein D3C72_1062250 [compost metagenome]
MRVTPVYKSGYCWLAFVAYAVVIMVFGAMFGWPTGFKSIFITLPCMFMCMWLQGLAKEAQFESDWALPKHPRIPVK